MSTQPSSPALNPSNPVSSIPDSIADFGILIVDDQPDHLEMMREILLKAGYRKVYSAVGGTEGLSLLNDQGGIGVVLLDLVMPGMDGYAVCRKIKENPVTQDVCVIVVTGGAIQVEEAISKSFEAGAIDFITKPLNRHDLLARTQSSLNLYYEKQQNLYQAGELLLREENYRSLFESCVDAIFVLNQADLVVLDANPAAENLLGFELDALSGRAFSSFSPKNASLDIYRRVGALEEGENLILETELVSKTGKTVAVEVRFSAHRFQGECRVMTLASDISLRNQTVEELKQNEERLALAVSGEDTGIWDWDISGGEIYFSGNWKKFLGIGKNALPRGIDTWKQHLHPADSERVLSHMRRHWNKETPRFIEEHRLRDRNGNYSWVLCRGQAVWNPSGEVVRMAGTLININERKKLEAQSAQLQTLDGLRGFARGVYRDLEDLVTRVDSHSRFIKEAVPGNKEVGGFVDGIQAASHNARSLVKQLAAFSPGKRVQLEYVFLNAELQNILPELKSIIGDDVTLETEFEDELPPIAADQPMLTQAILILIQNARDAMPVGGTLTLGTSQFHLDEPKLVDGRELACGKYLRVSVADNGIGMDEPAVEKIFEPFFSGRKGNGAPGGAGLGLSVVHAVMEQHSGWVSVKSRLGIGSRFDLFLPVF